MSCKLYPGLPNPGRRITAYLHCQGLVIQPVANKLSAAIFVRVMHVGGTLLLPAAGDNVQCSVVQAGCMICRATLRAAATLQPGV